MVYTLTSKLTNYNVEYRDGIKSKGDKIGMPCTHSTVIQDTSQPMRINDTSPILSQRHTAEGVVYMYVVEIHVPSEWRLVCLICNH